MLRPRSRAVWILTGLVAIAMLIPMGAAAEDLRSYPIGTAAAPAIGEHFVYTVFNTGDVWSAQVSTTTWSAGAWRRLKTHPNPPNGDPTGIAAAEATGEHFVYVVLNNGDLWSIQVSLTTWTAGNWRLLKTHPNPSGGTPITVAAAEATGEHFVYVTLSNGELWSVQVSLTTWSAGAWRLLKSNPDPPPYSRVEKPDPVAEPDVQSRCEPNPSASSVMFVVDAPSQMASTQLLIWDSEGRVVFLRDLGLVPPGQSHLTWDGRDRFGRMVPSGTYFYRVSSSVASTEPRSIALVR